MRILLKQEHKDIYKEVQSALKSNKKHLSDVCTAMGIDYMQTYKKLNASVIDYEWLCEFYSEALPGNELTLTLNK